jgi:hypothetical protein
MGQQACTGALMTCSFGAAPVPLSVLPANRVMAGGLPAATIMDMATGANVPPFGMCQSPANPAVAAATAAAMGALTPMPCTPVPAGPWIVGSPTVLVGGMPALSASTRLACAFGGLIQMSFAGQATVQIP